MILTIDFETRSLINLEERGLDNYSRDPSTQVLMLAYAFDASDIYLWEPHLQEMPTVLRRMLLNPLVTKSAWNISFERSILKHVLGIDVPVRQFLDIMVLARYMSLPGNLEDAGDILQLGDKAKLKEGKALLKMFCEPVPIKKPKNAERGTLFGAEPPIVREIIPRFYDHKTHPREWERLGKYCMRDVEAERTIYNLVKGFPLTQKEFSAWCLDQDVNETGLPVNRTFVMNALEMAQRSQKELWSIIIEKTGITNPNSRNQMLKWAKTQGYQYSSLEKGTVTAALNGTEITPRCREILTIRQESSKSSFKKFDTLKQEVSEDNRLRNQFVFLGAARTGRWSSGGVQVHNLPRPIKAVEKKYEHAVKMIEEAQYDAIKEEFKSVINPVVSCVRGAFQASEGHRLVVGDLGAIENRGAGWVAGCQAILDVFAQGKDPYLDFAVRMFKLPSYKELDAAYKAKDPTATAQRQISKPAVLGAAYALGGGEMKKNKHGDMVKSGLWGYAEAMGVKMTQEESHLAVKIFRQSFHEVPSFWKLLEHAAIATLRTGDAYAAGPIHFELAEFNKRPLLRIHLSSGRYLHYINARIVKRDMVGKDGDPYEKDTIAYDGYGHGVGMVQVEWGQVFTYGGKFFENIVQAVSRDILLEGMFRAVDKGFRLIGHFHDEIAAEVPKSSPLGLQDLLDCMTVPPSWAPGFPLAAAGWEGTIYKKG